MVAGKKRKVGPHGILKQDPAKVWAWIELIRTGRSIRNACYATGIPMKTIHSWKDFAKDPESPMHEECKQFVESYYEAKAEFEGALMDQIKLAASVPFKGGWKAAAWLLARKNRKEFGAKETIVLSKEKDGKDDPLEGLSDEELDRLASIVKRVE